MATGYWVMAPDQLARYREAVDDDSTGGELERIVVDVKRRGLDVEGPGLKTAPRGYPRDHPRVELLRRKSVAAMTRFQPAYWLGTSAAADRIIGVWQAGSEMNAWLDTHVGPSTAPPPEGR